jgi:phosphoribosylanthranilate isomerase
VTTVGVFVDRAPEDIVSIAGSSGITLAQLHGSEAPEACARLRLPFVKAIRIRDEADVAAMYRYKQARAFLLDTYTPGQAGGTGRTFPWEIAARVARESRIILSGGLTPETVAGAVAQVGPYAVDVCSGVESSPGRKDHRKVREFVEQAKKASAR